MYQTLYRKQYQPKGTISDPLNHSINNTISTENSDENRSANSDYSTVKDNNNNGQLVVSKYNPPKQQQQQQQKQQQQQQSMQQYYSHAYQQQEDFIQLANRRAKHNREVLFYLSVGDVIEYAKHEEIWNESDRHWALYIGNCSIIRFDHFKCKIVYESYWSLANNYFLTKNIDLDRHYYCLPIQMILSRVNYAIHNNQLMRHYFSSDKNFITWLRFDINKSDIEFSTHNNQPPPEAIKYMMITRFLDSIDRFSQINDEEQENGNNKINNNNTIVAINEEKN